VSDLQRSAANQGPRIIRIKPFQRDFHWFTLKTKDDPAEQRALSVCCTIATRFGAHGFFPFAEVSDENPAAASMTSSYSPRTMNRSTCRAVSGRGRIARNASAKSSTFSAATWVWSSGTFAKECGEASRMSWQ